MQAYFILYVADQELSSRFYAAALDIRPRLHVPGMTEFRLASGAILGLMPESGIMRLLQGAIASPALANGVPRAELYLLSEDAEAGYRRALEAGAVALSPVQSRDWGQRAGYLSDPDGHVLAFAEKL